MSFIELLQQVRATTLEAYEHQDAPFEKIVQAVVKERDMSRHPLFQVMFDLGTANNSSIVRLEELEISPKDFIHTTSKFDITFSVAQTDHGLKIFIGYCTDLYTSATIERMRAHYHELLMAAVAHPGKTIGKLDMLTHPEKEQLITGFNNTRAAAPVDKTVVGIFEEQVLRTPDSIVIIFGQEEITFIELNEKANQLAHYLRNSGLKAEGLVPLCFERSVDMIAAILGVLKAGGAYVPIDPGYPEGRIKYMLQDTGATLVVTNKQSRQKLEGVENVDIVEVDEQKIKNEATSNVSVNISPGSLAYVIYTSGSTGAPKGVMIEHRNLVNYVVNTKTRYINEAGNNAGSFMHLSYTFDASITAIFLPLLSGKALVIGSSNFPDIFEDKTFLQYAPYDFIKITPSHLEFLQPRISDVFTNTSASKLVIGGEALLLNQFDYLEQQGIDVEVINEYGPTEATVGCSTYSFSPSKQDNEAGNNIPIGKPIDNVELYILDAQEQVVPIGVLGELYIGGSGLARGYLNKGALTAEKFIQDPFSIRPNAKIYKTGDLAKWMPDGNIEYAGRIDDQVKLRGYRIELGEIQSIVQESGLVKSVVVMVCEDAAGNKRLIAYVVPDGTFDQTAVINYLKTKLPEYMVPSYWHQLEQFPLTINGKVDRKALPDPGKNIFTGKEYIAPETVTEKNLAGIWQDLLNLENVGVHDNFFEIGGHSLLAMRLIAAISKKMKVELTIRNLFQFTTIYELGRYIEIQTTHDAGNVNADDFELIDI